MCMSMCLVGPCGYVWSVWTPSPTTCHGLKGCDPLCGAGPGRLVRSTVALCTVCRVSPYVCACPVGSQEAGPSSLSRRGPGEPGSGTVLERYLQRADRWVVIGRRVTARRGLDTYAAPGSAQDCPPHRAHATHSAYSRSDRSSEFRPRAGSH